MIIPQYWEWPPYKAIGGEKYLVRIKHKGKVYECSDWISGYWHMIYGYPPKKVRKHSAMSSRSLGSTTPWKDLHHDIHLTYYDLVSFLGHYFHPVFVSDHPIAQEFADKIRETLGYHVLFGTSGTDANDAAIRLACELNPSGVVVSINNGFYGSDATALAACGLKMMRDWKTSFIREDFFIKVEPDASGLEVIEKLAKTDRLACVILEPVQLVGGCNVLPKEFLEGVKDIHARYHENFVRIVDEVSTAFRSGELLASKKLGYLGDIITLGKGVAGGYRPVSLTLIEPNVYDRYQLLIGKNRWGRTLAGTPLDCLLVEHTLNVYERWGKERVQKMTLLMEGYAIRHNIRLRGIGVMRAIDFRKSPRAYQTAVILMREHQIFTKPEGRYLMLMPPLVMPDDEIKRFFEVIEPYVLYE